MPTKRKKQKKTPPTKRVIEDRNKPRTLVQLVIGSRNSSRQHQIPDEETLKAATSQYFAGFTIFKGTGFWQATPDAAEIQEQSFSILIATTQPKSVESLARELIYIYKQNSVFLIKHEATAYFLSKRKKRKATPAPTTTLPITSPFVKKATHKADLPAFTMDVQDGTVARKRKEKE